MKKYMKKLIPYSSWFIALGGINILIGFVLSMLTLRSWIFAIGFMTGLAMMWLESYLDILDYEERVPLHLIRKYGIKAFMNDDNVSKEEL